MRRLLPFWLVAAGLCCLLAACGGTSGASSATATPQSLIDSAAAEATAIVQQARATALVLEARAQATALIQQAAGVATTPQPAATRSLAVVPSPTPDPALSASEALSAAPSESATASGIVEVVGIGFAADTGFITVQFRAPPRVAEEWWQGKVSMVDEATGAVYGEIPVIPKVGPLIGRPVEEGQVGYVMLVNAPVPLKQGALVTVTLGDYTFEHIPVE